MPPAAGRAGGDGQPVAHPQVRRRQRAGDGRVRLSERSGRGGARAPARSRNKLYGIDTAAATNVLGQSTLTGLTYTPVNRTLLFDLGTLGLPLDDIEGVIFGSRLSTGERSLILVANDIFSGAQRQQFLAFAVGEVPQPATRAMLVLGFSVTGASPRRRSRLSSARRFY